MITRDIYCYHEDLGATPWTELIPLWSRVWTEHGWTPHVLGIAEAIAHPAFCKVNEKAARLPTVNDKSFEMCCFRRWCAFAMIVPQDVPVAVADYDVFPRVPYPPREYPGFYSSDPSGGPGFTVGKPTDFERIVQFILSYEPQPKDQFNGRPHVSDMTVIQSHRAMYDTIDYASSAYGVPTWNTKPIVHFGGAYMKPFPSRLAQIREVLGLQDAL